MQKVSCKRTKASAITRNVILELSLEALVAKLKTTKFSIMIDESTDISTTKSSAIVVRYTMMGDKNSLRTRFKASCPDIYVSKCFCHSIHICASEATKTLYRNSAIFQEICSVLKAVRNEGPCFQNFRIMWTLNSTICCCHGHRRHVGSRCTRWSTECSNNGRHMYCFLQIWCTRNVLRAPTAFYRVCRIRL